MLFRTPQLGTDEREVLTLIRRLWKGLRHQLQGTPHRWHGFVRRAALARGIRGSNSIEGYLVSQDDAMAAVEREEPFEAFGETWAAIIGYREAMTYVLRIASDPHASLDLSLIRSLHFMMMSYALDKSPGSWRTGAIFVRDEDSGRTVYEGPDASLVPRLMDELIAWIHQPSNVSPMLIAAMAHLNLVMIHPFRDGNGRMGRCLQTMMMARAGVYDPIFCSVEEYLGKNTRDYYDVLAEVGGGRWQPNRDAMPWIRFMLTAHYRQASTFLRRLNETGEVWDEIDDLLEQGGLPGRAAAPLVEAAFGHRIRNPSYRRHADVSSTRASRDLKALVAAGFLVPHGERRGRWYEASEMLKGVRERHHEDKPIEDPFEAIE